MDHATSPSSSKEYRSRTESSQSNTPPDQPPVTNFRRGGKKLAADGTLRRRFAGRVMGWFSILRVGGERCLILLPLTSYLLTNCGTSADIETEGTQVDDVAHGGHAANAYMSQVHLVF